MFQRRGARIKGVTSPARVAVVVAAAVEHLERVVHRHCMRAAFHRPIGLSERREAGLAALLGEWTSAGCDRLVRCGAVSVGAGGAATAMAKHAATTTAAGGA